jgi:hypothetical protein
MTKKFPKILKIFFLTVFLFELIGFGLILTAGETARAADSIILKYAAPLPGGPASTDFTANRSTKPIADYIKLIYKYAIGVVGILATVVMMIGGIMWIMSGGSPERTGEAKAYISASLTGLILTLCSYLILATVNPALTNFKLTEIPAAGELGCCYSWTDSSHSSVQCDAMSKTTCDKDGRTYYASTCGSVYWCTGTFSCGIDADNGTTCIASDGYRGYCLTGASTCNKCKPDGSATDHGNSYECCSGKTSYWGMGSTCIAATTSGGSIEVLAGPN